MQCVRHYINIIVKPVENIGKVKKTATDFSSGIHPTCCIPLNTPVIMGTSSLANQYTPKG